MKNIRILLCCGAGMSSGFLANSARKAAKKKKLDINIEARSQSDISSYMSSIDILLVGPHYAGELDKFKELAAPYNIPAAVIPKDVYTMLNGEALLDFALKCIEEFQK